MSEALRLIQIACGDHVLYGLDAEGQVWEYQVAHGANFFEPQSGWVRVSMEKMPTP